MKDGTERAAPAWLKFVSGLSGWSLVGFGLASVVLATVFWTWAGVLVGLAMLGHGGLELWQRRRLLADGVAGAANWMAANQLALGATLTVYLASQSFGLDEGAVDAALQGDLAQGLLASLPAGAEAELRERVVALAGILVVALVAALWIGCAATALGYWRYGRKVGRVGGETR